MPERPLVSIACSVYNEASHVEEAIASICNQQYTHWELLLLDDGSTDDTVDRIRRFTDPRIRLFTHSERRGLPVRLNQAVAQARGSLIARMDADDVSYPERLTRQVEYLEMHPEIDLVATNLLVMDMDGTARGTQLWRGSRHEDIVRSPWSGFHFNHATWLGRVEWFRKHPYREDASRAQDDELMLRTYRSSHFELLEDVLYAYRVGPLPLYGIVMARHQFMRSLVREAWRQRHPVLLGGVPLQLAKMGVDVVAIGLKVERWLLRHRANGQPSEEQAARLRNVLAEARALIPNGS